MPWLISHATQSHSQQHIRSPTQHSSTISDMDSGTGFFSSIKGSIKGRMSRSSSSASASGKKSLSASAASTGPQQSDQRSRGVSSNPFFSQPAAPAPAPGPSSALNDPPPAYAVTAPASNSRAPSPTPSRLSAIRATTPEDQYAFLSSFDTIFLIDDSGSMAGRSWREVHSALASITPICTAHDADGVDIYFLNHRSIHPAVPKQGKAQGGYLNITNAAALDRIFTSVRPNSMTPTGTRLNQILKVYLRHYETAIAKCGGDPDGTDVKPINVIVITDGVPSDDPESVILSVAQKLDKLEAPPHQVGIQFFQVGNEAGASEALRALDDDLSELGGGVRDMVDTVTFGPAQHRGYKGPPPTLSADAILKTVLGAVVKRLDRARILEEERRSMRSGLLAP